MLPNMQLQLFECGAPPRPKMSDNETFESCIDIIMPQIMQWNRAHKVVGYEALVREELCEALLENPRRFITILIDDYDWSVDNSLLNILDTVPDVMRDVLINRTKLWVLQHGVSPKYSEGQHVVFNATGGAGPTVGVIAGINESTAEYRVCELVHTQSFAFENVSEA